MAGTALGDMVVRIVGDNAQFDTSIDKSQKKFDKFSKTALKAGKNLTKFVTLPILALGAASIKAAADMEMQEAAFTTLLGSAERAKDLLKELKEFAAVTPFSLGDLTNSTRLLVSFGIEAEKAVPIMKQIGDIAQGNKQKFASMSLAFGQASSTGRLMGQDLLQMINAGFNPLLQISEDTGRSMKDLKEDMSKGLISVEMLETAFKNATKEGGRFFDGMKLASQTLHGQFSTLLDSAVAVARSFGEVMLPAVKDITVGLTNFARQFTDLDDGTKKVIITTGRVVAAIGPLLIIVSKTITMFGRLKTAFIAAKVAFIALNTAMKFSVVGAVVAGIAATVLIFKNLTREIDNTTEALQNLSDLEKGADKFAGIDVGKGVQSWEVLSQILARNKKRFEELGGAIDQTIVLHERLLLDDYQERTRLEEAIRRDTAALENMDSVEDENRKKQQARFAKAQAALNAEIALIDNKAEQARLTGEEINVIDEKRAALIKQINLLREDGFKFDDTDKNNIRVLIGDNIELIELWEDQIVLLEEKRQAEIDEEEASAAAAQAAQELAAQEQENFDKRVQFHIVGLSQKKQELAAIERERRAFVESGVSIKDANDWARGQIDAVNQRYHDAELARIESIKQANVDALGQISSMVNGVVQSSGQGAYEAGKAWANMVADLAIQSGDANAMIVGGIIKAVIQIVEAIKFVVEYRKNQIEKLAAIELEIGNNLRKLELDAELANNKLKLASDLKLIDDRLKAELAAAGFLDKTRSELAQERLDKERDDLTAEEIAEAESEITRLGIIEKYEKKRTDAIEAAAVIERRINRDLAIFNRELAVDQAEIDREAAKASLGWFARGKKAEVDALYSELIAKIAATPLPALASGGIALPSRGGSTVQVAEAGVPELILPLDRLDSVLSQIPAASGGGTDGEGDIHLVVNMDSEPILSKIFPATRDRRVLIDANAVVS